MANRALPNLPDEQERLQDLLHYRVLDTPPEPVFDNITSLAALICQVPFVVITLIDARRQWFKSRIGLELTETPREIAFCAHTIAGRELLVVNDAHSDPRFRDNPFVISDPKIRFYAGAPLITPHGHAIGTLAVLDRVPRDLSPQQRDVVQLLARQIVEQLEIRRRASEDTGALRAILTASPRAIVAVDSEERIILWNQSAERMFGYSSQEVLGKRAPVLPGEGDIFYRTAVDRVFEGQTLQSFEGRRRRKDGSVIEISVFASPVRNDLGQVIGSIAMIDDITEGKRNERRLLQLGAIVHASADAIVGATMDGTVTAWNRGAEQIFGYSAEEVLGTSLNVLLPSDRQAEAQELHHSLERGEPVHNLETVRIRKDGEPVHVSMTVSPVRDESGAITGFSCVAQDIMERNRARHQLETSLSLMKATLDSTADGILALDKEGNLVSYNQRFAEMWRVPQSILDAKDTRAGTEFVADQLKDPEYFRQKIRRYFEGEELDPFDTIEFKDGRVFERYVHPQIVGGKTVGFVFSYRDMTRRTQLEQQLRQAQKMEAVGQLAGGIAHDFNNLLNVIMGYGELARMQLPENSPLLSNTEHIIKAAQSAAALTRQLLVFSRKQKPQLQVLNINTVLTGVSSMLRRIIGEDVDLTISPGIGTGNVKADPGQIEQVILNLAINARDAMPNGGSLDIATSYIFVDESHAQINQRQPGDYALLTVQDAGEGMTDEVKSHIFEPFFTTKQPGKGTGLGLATVYAIVEQNCGFIQVDSAPGQGTVFRLYFPVVQQPASASRVNPPTQVPVKGGGTVLVVEDEESLRKLISLSLDRFGYHVLEAKDGAEALDIARQEQRGVDLLITDMVLPRMRGSELAKRLVENLPRLKILYISGYADQAIDSLGENADFLQKPFTPAALADRVQAFLAKPQTGESLEPGSLRART
jgi:PAS domain S-box-containing protein